MTHAPASGRRSSTWWRRPPELSGDCPTEADQMDWILDVLRIAIKVNRGKARLRRQVLQREWKRSARLEGGTV